MKDTDFKARVQAHYDQLGAEFAAKAMSFFKHHFKMDYLNHELRGGFLTGSVMYDWDWKRYVEDSAFNTRLLESDFRNIDAWLPGGGPPDQSPRLVENQTRLGFEIETGHLQVSPGCMDLAQSLVNRTLATTDYLEMLVDDLQKDGSVQIEFRTRPLTLDELGRLPEIHESMKKSINGFRTATLFPKNKDLDPAQVGRLFADRGWTPGDAMLLLWQGLSHRDAPSVTKPSIQHATHSIPLSAFAAAPAHLRETVLPGSGTGEHVTGLLQYFFAKLRTQCEGETLVVSTTGRNAITPNLKTALSSVFSLLDYKSAVALAKEWHARLPRQVGLYRRMPVPLAPLQMAESWPHFPEHNPAPDGTGHLAAEEKLKPAFLDPRRQDVRVLVEHRADGLVKALNAAAGGQPGALDAYIQAFRTLDTLPSGDDFKRWFD